MPPQWNDRLLGEDRALELVTGWPLTATYELAELSQFEGENGPVDERPDQWQINLRCATIKGLKLDGSPEEWAALEHVPCGQSVAMLAAHGQAFTVDIPDLIAGCIRHQVMAHNRSLSGAGQ